jgi:hypothetical protein
VPFTVSRCVLRVPKLSTGTTLPFAFISMSLPSLC